MGIFAMVSDSTLLSKALTTLSREIPTIEEL
jgi:hypothetical protein